MSDSKKRHITSVDVMESVHWFVQHYLISKKDRYHSDKEGDERRERSSP